MPHLQLADNRNRRAPSSQDILEYMLHIPNDQGGMSWVREDQLDELDDYAFEQVLNNQPHLSEGHLAKGGRARRMARRKERRALSFTEREGRRGARMERKGGTFLDRFGQVVGGVVEKFKGEEGAYYPDQTKGSFLPQITGGLNIGVAKWWQNPLVIGGAVIGTGLIIWGVTKMKK